MVPRYNSQSASTPILWLTLLTRLSHFLLRTLQGVKMRKLGATIFTIMLLHQWFFLNVSSLFSLQTSLEGCVSFKSSTCFILLTALKNDLFPFNFLGSLHRQFLAICCLRASSPFAKCQSLTIHFQLLLSGINSLPVAFCYYSKLQIFHILYLFVPCLCFIKTSILLLKTNYFSTLGRSTSVIRRKLGGMTVSE